MPWIDYFLDGEARLNLSKGTPVAIIVMAYIVMPQHDGAGAFVRSAQVLLVPVHYKLLAIWIERRHQHDDDVVQDGTDFRSVTGSQAVGKLGCALRAGYLRCMNDAGNE